jgi:rhodanese-related sulfurtransferase
MSYDIESAKKHFAQRMAFTTGPHELAGMIDRKDDIVIVDVRFPADYRKGHVPAREPAEEPLGEPARPLEGQAERPLLLRRDLPHGRRGRGDPARAGLPVVEMEGGFAAWEAKSNPIVTSAPQAA